MRKRGCLVFAVLLVFSLVFSFSLVSAEKLVLNSNDKVNSLSGAISVSSLQVGDIFYLSNGKKARVKSIKDAVSDFGFDNKNFFANGVLVHNKGPAVVKIINPDGTVVIGKSVPKLTVDNFKQIAESHPHCQYWVKAISWEEGDKIYVIFWEKQTAIHHRDALASLLENLGHTEWAGQIRAAGQTGPIPLEVLNRAQGYQFRISNTGNILTEEVASGITTQIGTQNLASWNADKLSHHINALSGSIELPSVANSRGIDVGALSGLVDNHILDVDKLRALVSTKVRYDF